MNDKILYQDSNSILSFESLYCVGGYCIEEKTIQDHIKCIDIMADSLSGEMIIRDCESDAFLKLYFEDPMNFYVLGQIGGSHEDNILKFKLKADQTLLSGFKNALWDY